MNGWALEDGDERRRGGELVCVNPPFASFDRSRGGWGYHRTRVLASARVFLDWLVYALGSFTLVWLGMQGAGHLRLWDVVLRSLGVFPFGTLVALARLLGWCEWDLEEQGDLWEGGEHK